MRTRSFFWIMKNSSVKTFGLSMADFEQVQRILGNVDHTYYGAEFSRASDPEDEATLGEVLILKMTAIRRIFFLT